MAETASEIYTLLLPHEKKAFDFAHSVRQMALWQRLKITGAYCSVFTLAEERLDPLGTYRREKPHLVAMYEQLSEFAKLELAQDELAESRIEEKVKISVSGGLRLESDMRELARQIDAVAISSGANLTIIPQVKTMPWSSCRIVQEVLYVGARLNVNLDDLAVDYNAGYRFPVDNPSLGIIQ